jgi:hypothetical protein
VPVAHACNPSYSEGRDQEDCGSKPAWANNSQDPILKKTNHKKVWWSDSRCRAWVQTLVPQIKIKERKENIAGGVAQAVDSLLSKCQALSSDPTTAKNSGWWNGSSVECLPSNKCKDLSSNSSIKKQKTKERKHKKCQRNKAGRELRGEGEDAKF